MGFYRELRRRNVFKVAIVYAAAAWLLLQVSDTLGPALHLPDWFVSAVTFLLILGFPVAIILAWAFNLTPEAIEKDTKADASGPLAGIFANKQNYVVVTVLALALSYFVVDKFMLEPDRDIAGMEAIDQAAQQQQGEAEFVESDHSIAVLPFVNMSSDQEQEYFSDGLSEELLNLLAKIPELNVAARTSSFSFRDKDLEVPEIAARLKVAHVLEGSVRKSGNQIRITVQLIHADNGFNLWSETYDRQLDNIFEIQEEIAVAVADALRINLLGEEPKTLKTDPVAYQLFLEGQYLKRQISRRSLDRAIEVFKQAVEIDPAYAPAWAELADTYMWGGRSDGLSYEEASALAVEAVQTAINLDPDYAFAYYVRGIASFFVNKEFNQGIEDFQHALELNPENAFLVAAVGKGAYLTRNLDLAISQYQAALALEPLVPEFYWFLGLSYQAAGRLDDAQASFEKMSSLSPTFRGDFDIWVTMFLKGRFEAALVLSETPFRRAVIHRALGNEAEAEEALTELIGDSESVTMASYYGYIGENDKAFEWLDRSFDDDGFFSTYVLVDAAYNTIHSDPRWLSFLDKLGLMEFWLERTPQE